MHFLPTDIPEEISFGYQRSIRGAYSHSQTVGELQDSVLPKYSMLLLYVHNDKFTFFS
jgi:hypothetical protein